MHSRPDSIPSRIVGNATLAAAENRAESAACGRFSVTKPKKIG
jgi:hypothetical protein